VLPATAQAAGSPARIGWQQAIGNTVAGLGYELVETERAGRGLLRVTIDRIPGRVYGAPGSPDAGEAVTVEDCEAVTRQLQYVLEVEGLDYARLEVSSPGLDRPLRHEADYCRFLGQAVKITLREPFEGRKHWEGTLGEAAGEGADGRWTLCVVRGKGEPALELGFGLDEVREARLVPVLDFKGRKARPPVADDAPAAPEEAAPSTAPEKTTEAKGR
jgi:ribosome maturation factor RimP